MPFLRSWASGCAAPRCLRQATARRGGADRLCLRAIRDASRVVDLFAGCGTFVLPVSRRCEVHAVEACPRRPGPCRHGAPLETRDAGPLPRSADVEELGRFDAAIVDHPARAGLVPARPSGIGHVAMVSCPSVRPKCADPDRRLPARLDQGRGPVLPHVDPADFDTTASFASRIEAGAALRRYSGFGKRDQPRQAEEHRMTEPPYSPLLPC